MPGLIGKARLQKKDSRTVMTPVAIALNRFGYGYRRGQELPGDPRAWLRRQIDDYQAVPSALRGRDLSASAVVRETRELSDVRMMRSRVKKAGNPTEEALAEVKAARQEFSRDTRGDYYADVALRGRIAIESDTPFIERLVHFWANHFAVSIDKSTIAPILGHHEFAAVRPNVTGNFRTLLRAASLHPAMLAYLDQEKSMGPNSALLSRRRNRNPDFNRGLNENLGREILELHTLGVGGGYAQADVTELARALTGWILEGTPRAERGALPMANGAAFLERVHEPGMRKILGRSYAQAGAEQALAILDDLAVHPATARHIATKLARHFAGDEPPPSLVTPARGILYRQRCRSADGLSHADRFARALGPATRQIPPAVGVGYRHRPRRRRPASH